MHAPIIDILGGGSSASFGAWTRASGGASAHAAAPGATGLPLLDAQARAAYRRRLTELREELEEAERFHDTGRSERLRGEIDFIGEQLAAAVGLGGRSRVAADHTERARSAVTKRVKDTLAKIAREHPPLGRYLQATIRTGVFCAYVPTRGAR